MSPTKGHFQYSQKGKFKDCFDSTIWENLFEQHSERTLKVVVHNNSVSFSIPYNKRDSQIALDLDSVHSTNPDKFSKKDYNSYYEFSINSEPVELIELSEGLYKFYNDKSELKFVEVSENLVFIRH